MNADVALARLAADPADPADLAPVVLALAADEYPDLDAARYLRALDDLAARLRPRLRGSFEARVNALTTFLFDDEGFTGNAPRYYDPRNSYLNDVLDRRLGIPITLSLVAMAVGQRCDLEVVGVGLPGHFVAKAVEGGDEVIFDPFHGGQVLDADACASLVESVAGVPFDPTPGNLAATPPGAIVRRVLTNLKVVYADAGDFHRAARAARRLVQLDPSDVLQNRDLGVLLARAGRPHHAIGHLEVYLAANPNGTDAAGVHRFLKEARKTVAGWN